MFIRSQSVLIGIIACSLSGFAQNKRLVTPQDCVQTRYLLRKPLESALKINHQGTLLAYLVKAPNIRANMNEGQLYVSALTETTAAAGNLLASDPQLSQLEWLADGRHIAALTSVKGHVGVALYDAITGKSEVLVSLPKDIGEYAISGDGQTLVYALREDKALSRRRSDDEIADGYRIPNDSSSGVELIWDSAYVPYKLWIQRRARKDGWKAASVLSIHSPFTGKRLETVGHVNRFSFSFSPDGRRLFFNIADTNGMKGQDVDGSKLPTEWINSLAIKRGVEQGSVGSVSFSLIQDLTTGLTSMPIATPAAVGEAQWSQDSRYLFLVAEPPVGSKWEADDDITHPSMIKPAHLWRVELANSKIDKLFPDLPDTSENPLLWVKPHSVGVRTRDNRVVSLATETAEPSVVSELSPVILGNYSTNVDIVPNQPIYLYGAAYPGGRIVNKAAFALPAAGMPGNAGRNFVRGFGDTQANLAVRRDVRLRKAIALEVRAEAFNVLNHPIFGYVDPGLTSATFGQATKTLARSLGSMNASYQQGGPRSSSSPSS